MPSIRATTLGNELMFDLLIAARSFGYSSDRAMQALKEIPDLRVDKPSHAIAFTESEMCDLVPGKDAVVVGTDKVTKTVIARADRLKVISKHGVGVDNVDVAAATEAGILVTNLPGFNDSAVADMTFGMILTLVRGICLASSQVKNGNWNKLLAHDVWGKTLGVIGTGNIGQEVIRRARAFDMEVLAYDALPDEGAAKSAGYTYTALDELIANADVITVHVPLTEKTRGLIGEHQIEQMKPTACLVNTSRGGIVDEGALVAALKENRIAGAAVDVYETTFPQRQEVYECENLIVTPHIAAYTYETLESMDMAVVDAYREIVRGDIPTGVNILNPEIGALR